MANKQIVDYIKEADENKLNKAEIIQNLKQAGWGDEEIKDGFAYVNLYTGQTWGYQQPKVSARADNKVRYISLVALALGYLWLVSGLNKILGGLFVEGFGEFVRNQIENGQAFVFYKNILASVVLPNASIFSQLIQYSELTVGAALIIFGFWNLFSESRVRSFLLCIASIASFVMLLNIILSFGMPLPWIDKTNAFAQGMSIEYFALLVSFVLSVGYFHEI